MITEQTTDEQTQVEPLVSGLLPGLIQRVPELGRIRMGETIERKGKTIPRSLDTFRLTSHSKMTLEAAAALYGGKVEPWKDAPNEGMFELTTTSNELDVLVPAMFNVVSQSMELWQGGTCERRCDETTEFISGQSCLCAADGLAGPDRLCGIITRLRIMLPDVPGLGVWRLDTGGYFAATSLPATVQLLARLMPGQWIPAVLRAEQRSSKSRVDDGKGGDKVETHRFVVPVIDIPGTTIGQIVGGGDASEPRQLEQGERKTPLSAAEKAAARRAQLEARAGGSAEGGTVPDQAQGAAGATAMPATKHAPVCQVRSPRGDLCSLPAEPVHDYHERGRVKWPTPNQPAGSRGPSTQSHGEAPKAGTEGAPEDGAAGVVTAPADLTTEAAAIFESEPTNVSDESGSCTATPPNQLGMTLICEKQDGHKGPHVSTEGSWPAGDKQ